MDKLEQIDEDEDEDKFEEPTDFKKIINDIEKLNDQLQDDENISE